MSEQLDVAQLTETELAELVISSIEAFHYKDGPYLEREHRALARKHGYDEERVAQFWRKAAERECERAEAMQARMSGLGARLEAHRPKRSPDIRERYHRRLAVASANRAQSFSVPAPQPMAEPEPQNTPISKATITRLSAIADQVAPVSDEKGTALVVADARALNQLELPVVGTGHETVGLLNLKHAVIGNYGGKCLVLSWERWAVNEGVLAPTYQKFEDFKHRYMNHSVEVEGFNKVQRIPAGEFWLKSPGRATYEGVVFDPGGPAVLSGNRLNLWRGFSVVPQRGNWSKIENHIYNILANGDQRGGDYIVKWKAWMYQNLGEPPGSALVFQGDEGVGKGIISKAHMRVLGHCAMPIADREQFVGTFNGHLQYCVFVFLDEVAGFKDKKAEGILKTWLTEKTVTIRALYTQAFQARNTLHVNMASNNDWAVPAGPTSRRYSVFGVSDKRRKDEDYFNGILEEIDNGGAEGMVYDMLRMDLRGWHPGRIYETAALTKQKQRSLWGIDAAIETWLQNGSLPGLWPKYPNRAFSEDLWNDARKHETCSETQVIQRCQEIFGKENFQPKSNGKKRGWIFPPLRQCRKFWETKYGGTWVWVQDLVDWN